MEANLVSNLQDFGCTFVANGKSGMLRHSDSASNDLTVQITSGGCDRTYDRLEIALYGEVWPFLPLEFVLTGTQKNQCFHNALQFSN
jgi:hypothetical protein